MKKIYRGAEINGVELVADGAGYATLPNILNVYLPGVLAEDFLTRADIAGIAISSGSACRSRAMESSYVIRALGFADSRAKSSVRFSLGRGSSSGEIAKTLKTIAGINKGV